MTELQTYQSDPNDALLELGPADEDIMNWRAVMTGVSGTAYEGTFIPYPIGQRCALRCLPDAHSTSLPL